MATETRPEIGIPEDETEVRAYADILTQSLFFPPFDEFDWPAYQGMDTLRVIRSDGQVAGGLGMLRMGQWFGGRSVPMTGINAVGVAPEYRSTGVATRLLRATLEELRDERVPLSVLYPATQPVYRRVGYEQAGVWLKYRLPTQALDVRDRSLPLRRMTPDDHDRVRELYAERARRGNGNLDRSSFFWRRVLSPPQATVHQYVVGLGGELLGYVAFTQQKHPQDWNGDILVRDLVALTPDAGRRLLTFFADHRSKIDNVVLTASPAEPLFYLFANQDYRVDTLLHWMLRVVDVRGALESRGYREGLEAQLHLEVSDDVLPDNAGRWVLEVSGGRGSVRQGGEGRMRVDVRGLAPMYTGHLSAEELQATGYVTAADEDLATASQVFAGPTPWMPDMF